MNYASYLDTSAFARFLRRFSERYAVQHIKAKIVDATTSAFTGHVRSLTLNFGADIEGG